MYEAIRRGETLELMLYDDIGAGWFGGITSSDVVGDLGKHADATQIDVRINSPGGDVFEGVAIHNALQRHSGAVTVHIDALAASIASVIAMAGDSIEIAPTAMMMIHNAWTLTAGDATEHRRVSDLLDKVNGTILAAYTANGIDEDAAISAMNAETWYTADEAVAFGLANSVAADSMQVAAALFDAKRYRNTPERFKEKTPEPKTATAWKRASRERQLRLLRR